MLERKDLFYGFLLMIAVIVVYTAAIAGLVNLFNDLSLLKESKYHILILDGDKVLRKIGVPDNRFIFVVGPAGVGYKDTSNEEPFWFARKPYLTDKNIFGEGHRRLLKKYQ